jgi:hypothetical protein
MARSIVLNTTGATSKEKNVMIPSQAGDRDDGERPEQCHRRGPCATEITMTRIADAPGRVKIDGPATGR